MIRSGLLIVVAVLLAGACSKSEPGKSKAPAAATPAPSAAPPPAAAGPAAPVVAPASNPLGTWLTDEGKTKLVLEQGGTFVMDTRKGQHVTGTFTLEGDQLALTGAGEGAISGTFRGTLKGSTLELQFGPKTSVFERAP